MLARAAALTEDSELRDKMLCAPPCLCAAHGWASGAGTQSGGYVCLSLPSVTAVSHVLPCTLTADCLPLIVTAERCH